MHEATKRCDQELAFSSLKQLLPYKQLLPFSARAAFQTVAALVPVRVCVCVCAPMSDHYNQLLFVNLF